MLTETAKVLEIPLMCSGILNRERGRGF